MSRRASELAKPVKGKKRPAGLVALVADLKSARDELRDKIENLDLEEPLSLDNKSWETAQQWTSPSHVEAISRQIQDARKEYQAGIARLLGSKAL